MCQLPFFGVTNLLPGISSLISLGVQGFIQSGLEKLT